MADTIKTVTTKTTVLTGFALGVAIGAGSVYVYDQDTDQLSPVTIAEETKTDELLEAATEECRAEVEQAGDPVGCVYGCTTILGNAKTPVEGWCCNGAFMPQRVQDCLDVALDKITPKAIKEAEATPK